MLGGEDCKIRQLRGFLRILLGQDQLVLRVLRGNATGTLPMN